MLRGALEDRAFVPKENTSRNLAAWAVSLKTYPRWLPAPLCLLKRGVALWGGTGILLSLQERDLVQMLISKRTEKQAF